MPRLLFKIAGSEISAEGSVQEGDQKSYTFHPNLLISMLYVVPVTHGSANAWKIINVVFLWQNYQKKINNLCVGGLGK